MNEIIEKENIKVEDLIYEINGIKVMLDSDLAKLYQCRNGTKEINQAVKNNIEKFPQRFSWNLNNEEFENLRSKILTSNYNNYGGRRYLPRVFTEQGVAMLATILKSKIAIEVSIRIMDAFVAMKRYISKEIFFSNIEYKLLDHDKRIGLLEESFDKLSTKEKNNHIFYEGQIYDAYSLMKDILNTSTKSIIIIDNYLDKNLLDILSKINKEVTIITNKYNNGDYNIYKKQYYNIKLIISNTFHDRFIIIDKSILYHCGSSFKDLGKKCFGINKISDEYILNNIIKTIKF